MKKNVTDNQLTFLEKSSEILVDINNQNVLDIESCSDNGLEGIPIGCCGGRKTNNKFT